MKRVHLLAGVLAVLVASFASADIPPIMPPPVTGLPLTVDSLTVTNNATVGGTASVAGNSFTVGTSTLVVSAGKVGIGTASPATTLDVNGSAQFGSGATKSTFTATGDLQISTITMPAWTSYVPVWTGFSSDPTASAAYTRIGKTCIVRINATADGTSNSTGFAFTLPFNSKAAVSYAATGRGIDNGALNLGVIYLGAASSTANVYFGVSAGNWTNSGAKSWSGTITYETE